jgi:hypothetical protein
MSKELLHTKKDVLGLLFLTQQMKKDFEGEFGISPKNGCKHIDDLIQNYKVNGQKIDIDLSLASIERIFNFQNTPKISYATMNKIVRWYTKDSYKIFLVYVKNNFDKISSSNLISDKKLQIILEKIKNIKENNTDEKKTDETSPSIANNIVIKNIVDTRNNNRWILLFLSLIIITLVILFSTVFPINDGRSPTNNYHIENVFVSDSNKIIPDQNTQFFNDNGQSKVWYTNYKGDVEFYNTPGKHPFSNQQLQPVSKEVFETFISKNILNKNSGDNNSTVQTSASKTKNSPNSKEINVVMLNGTYQVDAGITNILGKWLTEKGYTMTAPFITSNTSTNETISRLQALDSDYFNVNLKDYSDYLCIGTVSYSYVPNSMIAGRTNCQIQLAFQIISTSDGKIIDNFSNLFIGNGSDSISAKNNTIKKISL